MFTVTKSNKMDKNGAESGPFVGVGLRALKDYGRIIYIMR